MTFIKPEVLDFSVKDSQGRVPNEALVTQHLRHTGNNKIYRIVGFAWLGATDEWGFIHHVCDSSLPFMWLVRPLSHLHGNRTNSNEQRYELLPPPKG